MAAKSENPLVSIVILNWNGLEDTKLCLEHVRKLNYPNYEVIVVDNGSAQNQKDYLSKIKGIIYIDNPKNRGFAGGQADGYKHANGEFILLLNNDAVIKSDYLREAMPLFDDSSVAAVGGRSYFWNDEEPVLDNSNRFYSYMTIDPISAETTLNMTDHSVTQEVNVVSGSAVIVRKSVADKVGYLWEPFFAYYEETDLFARFKRAGYKILYNPNLHIWHKNGASSGAQGGSYFFYYHIFRNRYMFAQRNFDDQYFRLFRKKYFSLARQALREAPRGPEQRRIAKAYAKAITYTKSRRSQLETDRSILSERYSNHSYSDQIIREQTSLSFVINTKSLSAKKLVDLYETLSRDNNPIHEYILVTEQDTPSLKKSARNVRFIVDREYFDTHSINLGCLAARHDWLIISDASNVPDTKDALQTIASSYLSHPSAIDLPGDTLALTKQLFEQSGGFQAGSASLAQNIEYMRQYAQASSALISSNPPVISALDLSNLRAKITLDRQLFNAQHLSKWQTLLSRYYRLQQLNNLATWVVHPKISPRLKVGRSKNIILSGLHLDKKRLATELKHIRNEVYLQSNEQKKMALANSVKKSAQKFSDEQIESVQNIPVFIVCFERIHELSRLVKHLEKIGITKIIFIDNDSTYKPLLDYYDQTPYQVLSLRRNIGHTSPWSLGIARTLIPHGYYIVTDPDVIPTDQCIANDPINHLIKIHKKYPAHQKVGLGLKIDDLPDHYPLKKEVIAWENQFWQSELESGIYEAGVDTTFALYKPGTYLYTLHPSLRTGEPFTARHTPWYNDPVKQTDEDEYYKRRANSDVTSWNVDELPERYKKEMENGHAKN